MRLFKITGFSALFYLMSFFPQTGLAQNMTNVGTDFWVAFQPNFNNNPPQLYLFISSNFNTSGSLYSAYPGIDQNFTVVPGTMTWIQLPAGVTQQGEVENKGIRITSNDPVSVYGLNLFGASTDGYMALPVNALGSDYRVVSYKLQSTPINSSPSRFSVVATHDNTVLTIFNHWTNSTISRTLNQGETYLSVDNGAANQDITGSRIQSNHPVAVFGSNDCVYIPDRPCQACDHTVEQMFPYYAWGKNFGTIALAGRDGSGDIFRVLSADDGNQISVNGSLVATINNGDYYETLLTGFNSITTTKPALLAQFAKGEQCSGGLTGDPLMMLIPPLEQFLTNYTIVNIWPFLSHWVNVLAPDYALGTIYQDGVLIPNSAFTQITGTNYYGAQRNVTQATHTFNSTYPFGVFVYGWTNADSYGYPGGCNLSHVATVQTIVLSPDTSYGQLNVTTVCLNAEVRDSQGNPVPGILVNFHVTGLGVLTGHGYTDSQGNAKYCYARTGVTPGEDHVFAEVSGITSNTVLVIWSDGPPCFNPSSGGSIGQSQSGCGSYSPSPLLNLTLPTGQDGTLEYKWQSSTLNSSSGFSDIPGSNAESYSPGSISQTTWYKRIARVDCKTSWLEAAESNVVELMVIQPLPVSVYISAPAYNVCSGENVFFTAYPTNGGNAPVYQWFINGTPAGSNTPTLSFNPADGDFVNCLLTSSESCISNNPASSCNLSVTLLPFQPVGVKISPSANPVCSGQPVTITAIPENGGSSPYYQWLVNEGGQGSNFPEYTYTPSNGDRIKCIMRSNYLCPDKAEVRDSLTLTVNNELKSVDTTLCYGVSYFVGGKWVTTPGVYTDTLPVPVNCIRYIVTTVGYKSQIPLELGPDTNLCGGTIDLDASVAGATYLWQDGATEAIYTADGPGTYMVTLTKDDCQVADSVRIEGCPVPLMFPSAFTPNGDGLNDTFHPVGELVPVFSMRIFNRWGDLLFETNSMEPGWDGTFKGQICPADTYVYLVNYQTINDKSIQVKGYVIISR